MGRTKIGAHERVATSKDRKGSLAVRSRRTLGGGGQVQVEEAVSCPRQAKSVLVEECRRCGHCFGTAQATALRPDTVHCELAENCERVGLLACSLREVPVTEVMRPEVVCVREDYSIEALEALFLSRGFSGVPVVSESGELLGVVSKTDLVRVHHDAGHDSERVDAIRETDGVPSEQGFHVEPLSQGTAGEIMTPINFSASEATSIAQAAALMAYEKVHRLPVLSRDRKVIGLVSSLDILTWLGEAEGYVMPRGS